jgi:hypothetical protein
MAEANMGKSIGNRECEWVRARLPLWVADAVGDEQSEPGAEGRDLSVKDSDAIMQHVAECATCRQHRLDLEQALGALAVAAAHLPLLQHAPSLWPELERRIVNPHASNGDGGSGPQAMNRVVRSRRPWSELDGDRPIRRAWTRDTLGELFGSRHLQGFRSQRTMDLILALSTAATILIGLIQFQILRRQWADAEATITANRAPLGKLVVSLTTSEEPPLEMVDRDKNQVPASQLAEAEPTRPAESPAAAVETVPIPKSSPATRFGFDLDHGTPMPPDSREAKPVY